MSRYSINYKKVMDGYNKIYRCIESIEIPEHLGSIPVLFDLWVNLINKYGDEIYSEKSNINRKKDAKRLVDASMCMFNTLKSIYEEKMNIFSLNDEYEGAFKPIRVMGFDEINDFVTNNETSI